MTDWVFREPLGGWYYETEFLVPLVPPQDASVDVPVGILDINGKLPEISTSQEEELTDVPHIVPEAVPQGGGVFRDVIVMVPRVEIISEPSAGGGDVQIAPPVGTADFVGQQASLADKTITVPLGQFEMDGLAPILPGRTQLFEGLRRHAGRLMK